MATYVTGTVVGGFAGRFLNGVVASHWSWRAGPAASPLGFIRRVSA
jgi:hypothetical protein